VARQDGRIEKGQPLRSAISARAWNRAQHAADVVLGMEPGATADGPSLRDWPLTWIYASNMTGDDLSRFCAVELADPWQQGPNYSAAQTAATQRGPVLNAIVPSSRQPWNNAFSTTNLMVTGGGFNGPPPPPRWGVPVEPIPAGAIGRVAVAGVALVRAAIGPGIRAGGATNWNPTWPQAVGGNVGQLAGNLRVTVQDGSVVPVIDYVGEADVLMANTYGDSGISIQGQYWALIRFSAPSTPGILNVFYSGTWESGARKKVTVLGPSPYDPPAVNASNPFQTCSTTGPKATTQFCSVAVVGGEWRLVSTPPPKTD